MGQAAVERCPIPAIGHEGEPMGLPAPPLGSMTFPTSPLYSGCDGLVLLTLHLNLCFRGVWGRAGKGQSCSSWGFSLCYHPGQPSSPLASHWFAEDYQACHWKCPLGPVPGSGNKHASRALCD